MVSGALLSLAMAGAPDALRPMGAPWDTPERWDRWAATQSPSPASLACDSLIEDHVLLCFRVKEGASLRWVTTADLAAWSVDVPTLRKQVTTGAATALANLQAVPVEGMPGEYLRLVDGEGWAIAPLLVPDQLALRLGPDARFALPAGTVGLAWRAGDGDLDKVLAVGVVELAKEQPGEVSRAVFRWDGAQLVPFAEAKPQAPVEAP